MICLKKVIYGLVYPVATRKWLSSCRKLSLSNISQSGHSGAFEDMENMKEKQKLDRRDTYTPTDAPQVRGNCDHALNSPETDSVHGSKTPSNNPDVDLLQPAGEHNANTPVFVFSVKQRRRNNRSLQTNRKGFRPSIRRRYSPPHGKEIQDIRIVQLRQVHVERDQGKWAEEGIPEGCRCQVSQIWKGDVI